MVIGSVYYKKKLVDENLTKDWVWQGMRQGGKERDREKGDIHRCLCAHARTRTHTRVHIHSRRILASRERCRVEAIILQILLLLKADF